MNRSLMRRGVLSGAAGLAVALAGCQRAGDGASGSTSTETATATSREPATPVSPAAWPNYRWKRSTEVAADELLADASEPRFYALIGDRTLAYGPTGAACGPNRDSVACRRRSPARW